jgi:phospholipid/cholesterol/gamma-HCH transport system substrate-binding protein
MQKRAPTLGNMVVIIVFALSCFGLLLFLWGSFGGPLPFKPKGYRVSVAVPRTLSLAEESDVKISGVNVGHVVSLKLGKDGKTHATFELASKYAPIRANTHAVLRQKTLLGETYIQLIPQGRTGPELQDGEQLPDSQVEPNVTLDDILALLDKNTRRNFQAWMQYQGAAVAGRGEQLNASIAEFEPFVESANKLVTVLATQEGAVRALVHNTGVVFKALGGRDRQLEELITNGEHTFHAAAASSQAFAEAFQALPAFELLSTHALRALDKFAAVSNPYLDEVKPVERQLTSLLKAAKPFAPQFNSFLTSVGPLTAAAKRGLPESAKVFDLTVPVLENLIPVLHNLDPFLESLGEYVPEVQAFFANLTAATEAHAANANTAGQGPTEHYLRTMLVFSPESLAVYPKKVGTDRSNAYPLPGGAFKALGNGGLKVFSNEACANSAPTVSGPPNAAVSQSLIELILQFKIANAPGSTSNSVAAPPCNQQGPNTFNGNTSQFPHVTYGGKG